MGLWLAASPAYASLRGAGDRVGDLSGAGRDNGTRGAFGGPIRTRSRPRRCAGYAGRGWSAGGLPTMAHSVTSALALAEQLQAIAEDTIIDPAAHALIGACSPTGRRRPRAGRSATTRRCSTWIRMASRGADPHGLDRGRLSRGARSSVLQKYRRLLSRADHIAPSITCRGTIAATRRSGYALVPAGSVGSPKPGCAYNGARTVSRRRSTRCPQSCATIPASRSTACAGAGRSSSTRACSRCCSTRRRKWVDPRCGGSSANCRSAGPCASATSTSPTGWPAGAG